MSRKEFEGFIDLISQSLTFLIEFIFSHYINIYFSHCQITELKIVIFENVGDQIRKFKGY